MNTVIIVLLKGSLLHSEVPLIKKQNQYITRKAVTMYAGNQSINRLCIPQFVVFVCDPNWRAILINDQNRLETRTSCPKFSSAGSLADSGI